MKFFSYLILLALIKSTWVEGKGLYIETADDMVKFSERVNKGNTFQGSTVFLMNDLDMKNQSIVIGNDIVYGTFKGTFDGQGYTIGNLVIKTSVEVAGLFGVTLDATLKNIFLLKTCSLTYNLANATGKPRVGGLVGLFSAGEGAAVIENVVTLMTISFTGSKYTEIYAGGISGYSVGMSEITTIKNSIAMNKIYIPSNTVNVFVGGISGLVIGDISNSMVVNCDYIGAVILGNNVSARAGGIVGFLRKGTVSNCVSNNPVVRGSSTDTNVLKIGDIVGEAENSLVSYCYNNLRSDNPYKDEIVNTSINSDVSNTSGYNDNYDLVNNSFPLCNFISCNLAQALENFTTVNRMNNYMKWVLNKNKKPIYFTFERVKNELTLKISTPIILLIGIAERESYFFDGWYEDKDLTKPLARTEITEPMNIFGRWTKWDKKYTVTFKGVRIQPMTGNFGDVISLPKGYKDESGSVGKWVDENGVFASWKFRIPAHDVTLHPVFIKTVLNTADDIKEFSALVNSGVDCEFMDISLGADIDFKNSTLDPIGKISNNFKGTFDGRGHIISGLNMTLNDQIVGFIGYSRGMTMRNLIIDSSCIYKNNYSFPDEEKQGVSLGGFVGYCYSSEHPCIAEGLIGMADMTFSGRSKVDESLRFGGVVGNFYAHTYKATVTNCMFYGKITYTGSGVCVYIGGVVGKCFGLLHEGSVCEVVNCMSTATAIGTGNPSDFLNIGGVVGFLHSNGVIKNCIWMGKASSTSPKQFIGAIVGFAINARIEYCYRGVKSGNHPLCGAERKMLLANNSYYDDDYNVENLMHINTYVGYSLTTSMIFYALKSENYSQWTLNYQDKSLTFVLIDENGSKAKLFQSNSSIIVLPKFSDTSDRKRFSGWHEDPDLKIPYNMRMFFDEMTLYGKWESINNCYYVTFNVTSTKTYTVRQVCNGESLDVYQDTPKRSGYEFIAWKNTDGYPINGRRITPKHDITLTAMWLKTKLSTPDDLMEFANNVNSGVNCTGKTIYLMNDIDMDKYPSFTPIGDNSKSFSGKFEGQGHRISNLRVRTDYVTMHTGLFGVSFLGTEIKNFVLDSSCSVYTTHNVSYTSIGSVLGYCSTELAPCKIVNVVNFANVEAVSETGINKIYLGGIIGICEETNRECNINNCANYGKVINVGARSDAYLGGIIGKCTGGLLKNFCVISNSLNYGFISTTGLITSSDSPSIGGIIGKSDNYNEINGCINMGNISSDKISGNIGGISGNSDGTSDISDNFWSEETFYGDFTGLNPEIQKGLVLADEEPLLSNLKNAATRKVMPEENKNGAGVYRTKWLLNEHKHNVTFYVNKKKFVTYSSEVILVPSLIGNMKYEFKGWYPGKMSLKTVDMDVVNKNTNLYGKWKKSIDEGLVVLGTLVGVAGIIVLLCLIFGNMYLKGYREIRRKNKAIKELLYPEAYDEQEPEYSINTLKWLYPSDYKRPDMETALIAAGVNEEFAGEIVEKCYENANLLEEEGRLGFRVTKDDAAAIAMYTYESSTEGYGMNPYRIINNALLSKDPEELKKVKDILYLVMTALRKLPIVHGIVLHRGIRDNVNGLQSTSSEAALPSVGARITEATNNSPEPVPAGGIQDNSVVIWESLSSTSPSMEVTKAFLTNGEMSGRAAGTLFIIENAWGYDVRPYSLYQDEAEILLEPERQFRVLSSIAAELTVVKLEMLKTPLVLPEVFGERDLKVPIFYFVGPYNESRKRRRRKTYRSRLFNEKSNENLENKSIPLLWNGQSSSSDSNSK